MKTYEFILILIFLAMVSVIQLNQEPIPEPDFVDTENIYLDPPLILTFHYES